MPVETNYQHDIEVNITESIHLMKDQFNAASVLFDELKHSATFIYELGAKLGLSNEEIDNLKSSIDGLFISINESFTQTSKELVKKITQNIETLRTTYINSSRINESTQQIPYDELYQKYNEVLYKNVELTAELTRVSTKHNDLHDHCVELNRQLEEVRDEKADLVGKVDELTKANQELEQQFNDAQNTVNDLGHQLADMFDENTDFTCKINKLETENQDLQQRIDDSQSAVTGVLRQLTDVRNENSDLVHKVNELDAKNQMLEQRLVETANQSKENQLEQSADLNSTKTLVFGSSTLENSTQAEEFLERTKTVEDFIKVFEGVFENSDELVQLIKQVYQLGNNAQKVYIGKTLEKSRHVRQVIHEVLVVFRKARINPSVLGEDVSAKVAEELKRIYETLKTVKISTEKQQRAALKSRK